MRREKVGFDAGWKSGCTEVGRSHHAIVVEVGVGKTQIQTIIKDREEITKKWKYEDRSEMINSKPTIAGYENLKKIVWEWFIRFMYH